MRNMAQSNHLPDYAVTLEEDQVVFWRRAGEGANGFRPNQAASIPIVAEAKPAIVERPIAVSEQAMERLYDIAPRWDKYRLKYLYINWAKSLEPALNEDARFLGWAKSYTKCKPAP